MTKHRDSTQPTLGDYHLASLEEKRTAGTGPAEQRLRDLESHVDRLYEKYYDIWDAVEKLSEGIAQTVPLPLKYK